MLLIPVGLVKVLEGLSHRSGYALVDIHVLVGPEARDVMVQLLSEFMLQSLPEEVCTPVSSMSIEHREEGHLHAFIQPHILDTQVSIFHRRSDASLGHNLASKSFDTESQVAHLDDVARMDGIFFAWE